MEVIKIEYANVTYITVSMSGKEREFYKGLSAGEGGTVDWLECVAGKLYFNPEAYKFWVVDAKDEMDAYATALRFVQERTH